MNCRLCKKKHYNYTQMILHINTEHVQKCEFCYRIVMCRTIDPNQTIFYCKECKEFYFDPKKIPTKINLPYIKCKLCPYRCDKYPELTSHISEKHTWKCYRCKKHFSFKDQLTYHVITKHNNNRFVYDINYQ